MIGDGLPEESRARLAGRLIDRLDPRVEQEVVVMWAWELERRSAELHAGEVETVPLGEALTKARKALGAV
ncbi:addiction module protein [Endothiovibrio diazotrophicus]